MGREVEEAAAAEWDTTACVSAHRQSGFQPRKVRRDLSGAKQRDE